MRRVASFAVIAATLVTARVSSAQEACIAEPAKKVLATCPNTGPQSFEGVGAGAKKPQVNFRTKVGENEPKKKDIKPPTPDQEMTAGARDQRASRLKQRQKALLVTEIQGIENLLRTTPKGAPDRVTIARRLAEAYVELENSAFREKTQAEIDRDAARKTNPQLASQKQAASDQANKVMVNARKQAINYYTLVKNEYPNYPQLDEVLYYLAYEHEQGNDYPNARKAYYELIQKKPSSKYIPNAYLAFGELFFNEAQGDPSKWELAAEAYKKVIGYPPPDNKVYGYSWYKLAYVKWNQGDFAAAIDAFKKTIDYGVQYAQLPGASKLADSARRDIIPVYALKGDPLLAYNFFRNISGDQPGSNEKTFKMMNDLGQNYIDTGHYQEAIALYKDLLVRDRNGDKICFYQSKISEAVLALRSGNKEAVKGALDEQAKMYNKYKNENHSAEAKFECANRTAELLTETAMAWHIEAQGSGGQRGTGDSKTMLLAAGVYKHVVDNFKQEEFEKFEFPKLVKEDWPNIYRIKYLMADILYFQQKWDQCGPAFDAVVAENPQAPEAAEAAFAAVLCYQKIYEQTHQKGAERRGTGQLPGQKAKEAKEDDTKFKPKEMTENQKGMVQAFNRYICYIKPKAGDAAGVDQLVEVKYARARTYFEAQHWEEAAYAFRDIALSYPDRDAAVYASQLYLESINILGAKLGKPACYDDMATDVPKFLELYCSGANASKNAEQCTILSRIQADILRLKAENLAKAAEKGGPEANANYEKSGNAYLELYRKFCEQPKAEGKPPQAERCEELLYNAGESFQSGRLIAKAIAARMILIDPKNGYEKTDLAKKAMYKIGGNYQAIAVYESAADWFEKYAKAYPKAEKADAALMDATVLRLGLGQEQQSLDDASEFQRLYGASKPLQTAQIRFAIAAHHAEREEWRRAKDALEQSMGIINRAPLDIQLQAHAILAKANLRQNKIPAGKAEYARVRGLWKDPAAGERKIRDAYPDEDDAQKDKRIGKALNAVGEAYFYDAEEQRLTIVEPVKFPEYKGPGTKEDVLKHIQTKVKNWYTKKREVIQKVGPAYSKILDLKPVPPPKWVIAAGSRYGLMWGDFVDDFRRAPIPKAWKKTELEGVYYGSLDEASEPFKVNQAKPALKKCLDLSVQFQYFDEYSRSCEVWLAKNYKQEYHVVDELRGAPTLSNSGLDDKAPPLQVGGEALRGAAAQVSQEKPAAKDDKGDAAGARPAGAPAAGAAAAPAGKPAKKGGKKK